MIQSSSIALLDHVQNTDYDSHFFSGCSQKGMRLSNSSIRSINTIDGGSTSILGHFEVNCRQLTLDNEHESYIINFFDIEEYN